MRPDTWIRHLPLEFVFQTPAFLEDAAQLADIDQAVFEAVMRDLQAAEGFLDAERLRTILGDAGVEIERQRDAVVNFILNLTRNLVDSDGEMLATMDTQLKKRGFEDQQSELVVSRVRELQEPIPALDLQTKAENLSGAIGRTYVSHQFVTDLRPVFNDARDDVVGMFPITTFKIRSRTTDGLEEHDVTLTEEELGHLCESIGSARHKVEVLKHLLRSAKITIPKVRMVSDVMEKP